MRSARRGSHVSAVVSSLRQLAALLGVSPEAARKWPANAAWELGALPTASAPWPAAKVQQLRAWRARHLSENPAAGGGAGAARPAAAGANQAAIAKTIKLAEEARRIKRENDLAEGKLIAREEVERQNVEKVLAVKTGLTGLIEECREFLAEDQLDQLEEKIWGLLEAFAQGRIGVGVEQAAPASRGNTAG